MTFEERNYIAANKRVSHRYGKGLEVLAPAIVEALIKAEVLDIIAANDGLSDNPLARLAAYTCKHVGGKED